MLLSWGRFVVAQHKATAMSERGTFVSVSQYVSIPVWEEADPLCTSMLLSMFRMHICAKFKRGAHGFSTIDELFDALSIGHVAWQTVSVRNLNRSQFVEGRTGGYPLFYMSKRMFGRLIHQLPDVRIRQNPWDQVEREGVPRLELIVH